MCKAVEEYAREKELEKTDNFIVKLLKRGRDTVSEISNLADVTIEQVIKVATDNNIAYTM